MKNTLLLCATLLFGYTSFAEKGKEPGYILGTAKKIHENSKNKHLQVDESTYYDKVIKYDSNNVQIGKLSTYDESDFFISYENNKVEGYVIISKKNDLAYRYSTNKNSNVVVTKVSVHELFCVNDFLPTKNIKVKATPQNLGGSGPTTIPSLNSKEDSKFLAYLDFDGYDLPAGTNWNSGQAVSTRGYNFTPQEIEKIWSMMAEDYAPFDINITTDEAKYNATPYGKKMRVVFTIDSEWYGSAGGVAKIGSYASLSGLSQPCWVFVNKLGNYDEYCAEAGSHELGHTFGLLHDGDAIKGKAYYPGHNIWGPIMGTAYDQYLGQFSKGEYSGANNFQDDFSVIQSALQLKADDHANNFNLASDLILNIQGSNGIIMPNINKGLIALANDVDVFKFKTSGGAISINFKPSTSTKANLDIQLSLYNDNNVLLQTVSTTHSETGIASGATISAQLLSGTYYIIADGIGYLDGASGWTDYGSVGPYIISGSIENVKKEAVDLSIEELIGLGNFCNANGAITPSFTLKNNGTQNAANVKIEVWIDGVLSNNETVNGGVSAGASVIVNLQAIQQTGNHALMIKVIDASLVESVMINNSISGTYTLKQGEEYLFQTNLMEFDGGFPFSWKIINSNSQAQEYSSTLLSKTSNNNITTQSVCLSFPECFEMQVTGSFNLCSGVPNYINGNIYVGGDKVYLNGKIYTANWWMNTAPPANGWTETGTCNVGNFYYELINKADNSSALKETSIASSPQNTSFCLQDLQTSVNTFDINRTVLFPNPNNGSFHIKNDEGMNATVQVFDISGSLVHQIQSSDKVIAVDTQSNLATGFYLVKFNQEIPVVMVIQ